MILVIDNYDSFTYNLVQAIGVLGAAVRVERNDSLTVESILADPPDGIVISPGPGRPEDAGICTGLIQRATMEIPILGVCLGHQAIGHAFGARIGSAPALMHGKRSPVLHDGKTIFRSLPSPFDAGRYHSLVVTPGTVPDVLEVTARTPDGVIMGIRHRALPIEGIQFHPESILTPEGPRLIANWISQLKRTR